MKRELSLMLIAAGVLSASAQSWHDGDVEWISSYDFAKNVQTWNSSHKLSADDNFFISRVRPKARFRNINSQVRESITADNDRRLVAWLPTNTHKPEDNRDCLPTGVFDSECFTMWGYVDHWGNWTSPMGQIPAGLSDVAHKNGVAVSSVASIPYGAITSQWSTALNNIVNNLATEEGGQMAGKFLAYYGHDGVGYNSEFSGWYQMEKLGQFHHYLMEGTKAAYVANGVTDYDMAENMWYDGTNINGAITFDQGLGSHNYMVWGPKGNERTSLFFNYNWTGRGLLSRSATNAANASMGNGRDTRFLYVGLNMQGGEPGTSYAPWEAFKDQNFGIGLWGAHSVNMFFEGRGSNGSTAAAQQRTYQQRIENWFTGGSHNPANVPTTLSNKVTCATDDAEFHGMSTFMSARSTLSWDLGKEAFVTYFNIGNGKFFNWKGERQNDNEWYNLGAQDFMPTWRWWWSSKFLGKDAADVPASGLTAAISWDDAYVGGSTVRITGSSTPAEYLQLLKTQFALKAGDVLTFTYKLAGGSANVAVAMSTERKESTVALELPVCETSQLSDDTEWVTKTYEVKAGDGLAGKTLAVVALKFDAATNLDFYLGELSIRRGALAAPVTPESPEVKVLRSHYAGIDAKLIFNVPNSKPADQVCYNDEVGTSIFKIWSQEEGKEAVLLGMTPSWAYLAYSAPFSGDKDGNGKIRFGVQSVSLDWNSESEIQWSDYVASGERAYSDQITVDKTTITPGEEFTLSTVDPKRSYKWQIWTAGDNSRMVAESPSSTNSWTCEGLEEMTTYDVKCIGTNNTGAESITYSLFLVVTNPSAGRLPEILTLTANGKDADIEVLTGNEVKLEYTGRPANGIASRGIELEEKFFGIKASEIMDGQDESFSIAGWLKITNFPGDVEWIDVRNPNGTWPRNNWGWLWTNISQDGTIYDFHHELSASNGAGGIDKVLVYDFGNGKNTFFNPGQWTHFAFTFERSQEKCRTIIYINGKRIESTWKYYTNAGDNYNPTGTPAQQGGTEDYLQAYKALDLNSYISICGTRHTGRGAGLGFTGVLDDFQIWNKAMTQDEVNASMAGLDGNNLPDGVLAFFDFEQDPGSDNMFVAKGKKTGAKAGYYQLGSGNTEGQGVIEYLKPNFMSGCPFIPGVDYKIETTPSWSVNKATLTGAQGTDEAGSVTATYSLPGEYTARLTLSNDLGSDSRTFQVIKVGEEGGINEIGAANMRTYTVDDQLFLEVAQSGNYAVSIYDLSGRQLAAKAERIEGGSYMRLTFRGLPGTYVVNVTRDGRPARAFKVIKK